MKIKNIKKKSIVRRSAIFFGVMFIVAMLVEMQISWLVVRNNAKKSTAMLLDQIESVLNDNAESEDSETENLKEDYISYAETIAYIISLKPEVYEDIDELKKIADFQNVDEIHIFDESGTIIAGTVPEYYGLNLDSGEQMAYFKPMLTDKSLSMCQDMTPNTAEGKTMMYAITWNQEGTLMIQVGIEPTRLLEELKNNSIDNVIDNIPINEGFAIYAVDSENKEIAASTNKDIKITSVPEEILNKTSFKADSSGGIVSYGGTNYYCNYRSIDGYLVAVVYDMQKSIVSITVPTIVIAVYLLLAGFVLFTLLIRLYISESEKEKQVQELTDYNRIISDAGYGVWHIILKDGAQPRMQVNDKMAELLGISGKKLTEEETYSSWYDQIVPEAIESVQASVGEMMEGHFSENTYKWKHPEKGIIYVRCGGTAQKQNDGSNILSGYHCEVTDIVLDEQKKKEELEKAKDAAEAANRAKTSFLFNMSHDIRTPMNAIIGYTDLIERNYEDKDKCMDYLHKTQASNRFLLSLINDVLEMARIESGKAKLDETVGRLGSIASEMSSIFEDQMSKKGIRFTEHVDIHTKYAFFDQAKVREIYLNILSNALKYTNTGGNVDMNVTELPSEKQGFIQMRIVISDTGIGMSEEFVPQIFEEFSREYTATESRREGTGLGMPIVKKIVELMGGTIDVKSKLGKGSVFTVVVPLRTEGAVPEEENKTEDIQNIDFSGRRILLAEDNDLNAEIAEEILAEAGFEVERAADGAICVQMLENASDGYYDLILMDVQMPNMDGYEAAKNIRKMEDAKKASIPIIAMTANAFDEDKRNALDAGMNAHLAKPIEIARLMETLAAVLK